MGAHDELEGGVPDHQAIVTIEQRQRAWHGVGGGAQPLQGATLADTGHQRNRRGRSQQNQRHGHHQGRGAGVGGGDHRSQTLDRLDAQTRHRQQMLSDHGGQHPRKSQRPPKGAGAGSSDETRRQRTGESGQHRGALQRQAPDQPARPGGADERRIVDGNEPQRHEGADAQARLLRR